MKNEKATAKNQKGGKNKMVKCVYNEDGYTIEEYSENGYIIERYNKNGYVLTRKGQMLSNYFNIINGRILFDSMLYVNKTTLKIIQRFLKKRIKTSEKEKNNCIN